MWYRIHTLSYFVDFWSFYSDQLWVVLEALITSICIDPKPQRTGKMGKWCIFTALILFSVINLNEQQAIIGLNYSGITLTSLLSVSTMEAFTLQLSLRGGLLFL